MSSDNPLPPLLFFTKEVFPFCLLLYQLFVDIINLLQKTISSTTDSFLLTFHIIKL